MSAAPPIPFIPLLLSTGPPPAAMFGYGVAVALLVAGVVTAVAGRWALRKYVLLERRTARAERLAELGMLTGGLAHEIKNPLSTVQLNLQLLREDLDDLRTGELSGEARDKAVGRMERRADNLVKESGRLRDILDDFLRYAGRLEPDLRSTDLQELCEELTDFLAPQAQVSRVTLTTELRPVNAKVDPRLVKQALLNLLLNALQHTAEGGRVTLGLRPNRPPREPAQVQLWVSDTGKGIAAEELPRVFDPYFSRRRGGTGLGLALTRRIAEAHGGTLEVDSVVGRGSTFTLTLPAAPAAHEKPSVSADGRPSA